MLSVSGEQTGSFQAVISTATAGFVGISRRNNESAAQMGDSSSLIIENALAFWWILMPPQSISIG